MPTTKSMKPKHKKQKGNRSETEKDSPTSTHLKDFVRERISRRMQSEEVTSFDDDFDDDFDHDFDHDFEEADENECEICRALGLDPDLKI